MRARDVNSWACEENKIFSPACILNRDELISQLSLETRERQIRIAGSPRWMQMWRVREWKRARRISRAINFTRASTTRHNGERKFRRCTIVNFITVATFYLADASLIIATFCLGFLFARDANTWEVRKTTKIMSSRLALPVSGPARTKTAIYVHGGCVFVYAAYTSTLTWQNGGKEERAQKASIQS